MKKTLLIIMTVALCASLMAQQAQKLDKRIPLNTVKSSGKIMPAHDKGLEDASDLTPALRTSPLMETNDLISIVGETHYNSPSNTNARNTINFRKNSTDAAVVWTMAKSNASRGTGISYYSCNEGWDVMPDPETGRIETVRTGWGIHGFTEEGEVVVSHDGATGLVVNTRDKWGEGAWNQYILKGPSYVCEGVSTTALLWPTMATNGNTVHMLCVTEQWSTVYYMEDKFPQLDPINGYQGFSTFPLYYRSTDGGKTWEEPVDLRTWGLTDYETFKMSADDYTITTKGDHIVLLISSGLGFVIYFESWDNGLTWEKKTVYHVGEVMLYNTPPVETVLLPQTAAICIDDEDHVHVVFNTMLERKDENGETLSYYPNMFVGTIYWNDTFEPLNPENYRALDDGEYFITPTLYEQQPNYLAPPSILGLDRLYNWSAGPEYENYQFHGTGWTAFTRIIAKDDRVYIAYQSPIDYPINFQISSIPTFARGIFMTVSDDNGATWDVENNTSMLSYNQGLLWVDWSQYVGPESMDDESPYYNPEWPNTIDFAILTENGYPTMSYNTKGDQFMIQWYHHGGEPFLIGENAPVLEAQALPVMTFTQYLKNIPAYKNTQEIWKGLWNIDEPTLNFPDPGCERPTHLVVVEDGEDMLLTWKAPEYINAPLTYYIIYRMGEEGPEYIGTSNTTQYRDVDVDLEQGTPIYKVAAYYESIDCISQNMPPITPGIKKIETPAFKLYPNPANNNNSVTISVEQNTPYTVTITNIMGQEMNTIKGIGNVNVNVSNYAPGIYIVNVRTATGVAAQKLIVK